MADRSALELSAVPNGHFDINNWQHIERFDRGELRLIRLTVGNNHNDSGESLLFKIVQIGGSYH